MLETSYGKQKYPRYGQTCHVSGKQKISYCWIFWGLPENTNNLTELHQIQWKHVLLAHASFRYQKHRFRVIKGYIFIYHIFGANKNRKYQTIKKHLFLNGDIYIFIFHWSFPIFNLTHIRHKWIFVKMGSETKSWSAISEIRALTHVMWIKRSKMIWSDSKLFWKLCNDEFFNFW